jgi:hypothetical protein
MMMETSRSFPTFPIDGTSVSVAVSFVASSEGDSGLVVAAMRCPIETSINRGYKWFNTDHYA